MRGSAARPGPPAFKCMFQVARQYIVEPPLETGMEKPGRLTGKTAPVKGRKRGSNESEAEAKLEVIGIFQENSRFRAW